MKKQLGSVIAFVTIVLLLTAERPLAYAQQIFWTDDFEAYPVGANLHGMGGWKGWVNDPTFTAYVIGTPAWNGTKAVDIVGNADLIREVAPSSEKLRLSFYQYIPGNMIGQSYLAVLNRYDDALVAVNWSVQVLFDSASGLIIDTGAGGSTTPYIANQWVPVCIDVDMEQDTQNFYYNNQLFYSGSWTQHVSGGGASALAAVDFFANGASSVYYDAITLASGSCRTRGASYSLYLPLVDGA